MIFVTSPRSTGRQVDDDCGEPFSAQSNIEIPIKKIASVIVTVSVRRNQLS